MLNKVGTAFHRSRFFSHGRPQNDLSKESRSSPLHVSLTAPDHTSLFSGELHPSFAPGVIKKKSRTEVTASILKKAPKHTRV